jgi:hypothetical protein
VRREVIHGGFAILVRLALGHGQRPP